VRFNDVEFGHAGEGNLDLDPLFAGGGEHPQALQEGSPCIDAGPPDLAGLGLPALDLAGLPRLAGGRLDMGCYEFAATVGIGTGPTTAARRLLAPVSPNPFNPRTAIAFDLPRATRVRLEIFDPAGRRVRTLLADVTLAAGRHEIVWSGDDDRGRALPSGVYVCRLRAGDAGDRRRLTLVR
jgi:hypothetical protein